MITILYMSVNSGSELCSAKIQYYSKTNGDGTSNNRLCSKHTHYICTSTCPVARCWGGVTNNSTSFHLTNVFSSRLIVSVRISKPQSHPKWVWLSTKQTSLFCQDKVVRLGLVEDMGTTSCHPIQQQPDGTRT